MSSCSQRIRIALSIKNLPWTSHIVRLDKGENAKAEYLNINPNGLVPSLINDGEVVTESIDILNYLEDRFGILGKEAFGRLTEQKSINLLQEIDTAQSDVKVCSFYFLFRVRSMMSDSEFEFFKSNHSNDELVRFHTRNREGLHAEEVQKAVDRTRTFFDLMEKQLASNNGYLVNSLFSVCDLALVPNVHRFSLMGWPFENYPKISAWFVKVKENAWFRSAIKDWEPLGIVEKFSDFVEKNDADNVSAYFKNSSSV
jgi:glutathione S-transferase